MKSSKFRPLQVVLAAGLALVATVSNAAVTNSFVAQGSGVGPNCLTTGVCMVPADVLAARTLFESGSLTHSFTNKQVESFMKLPLSDVGPNPNTTGSYGIFGNPATGTLVSDGSILDNDTTGAPTLPSSTGLAGRWDTTNDAAATWLEFSKDVVINIGKSVDAIGFYLTDLGDVDEGTEIEVFLDNATQGIKRSASRNPDAQVTFIGLYSDVAFSLVRIKVTPADPFLNPDDADFIGLDDIVIGNLVRRGNPVSAPGTLALLGLGLLAAGAMSRRRQAA
jgi:hypothetical protein